jgi:hypothetical protein
VQQKQTDGHLQDELMSLNIISFGVLGVYFVNVVRLGLLKKM